MGKGSTVSLPKPTREEVALVRFLLLSWLAAHLFVFFISRVAGCRAAFNVLLLNSLAERLLPANTPSVALSSGTCGTSSCTLGFRGLPMVEQLSKAFSKFRVTYLTKREKEKKKKKKKKKKKEKKKKKKKKKS